MKKTQWLIVPILFVAIGACRGQEKNTHTTPQPLPVMPWSEAKKSYITDPNGGKFRIIEANNNQATRQVGIEFLDTTGKVTKTFDLRTAPFAPDFLKAKENEKLFSLDYGEIGVITLEGIWIEKKNMSKDQWNSAMHPKYRNDRKVSEGSTSTITNIKVLWDKIDESNLSGLIVVEYNVTNYLGNNIHNLNSRLIVLNEQGNIVDVLANIPYELDKILITNDNICYSFNDSSNLNDLESGMSPEGIRTYNRNTKKYEIDKIYGEELPFFLQKIESKIILSCNGENLGKKGYTIVFVLKSDKIFRKDERLIYTPEGYGYGGEIRKIEKDTIIFEKKPNGVAEKYDLNKDFQIMTYGDFNNLKFTKSAE
ncbi:MAG: hypothetical protein J5I59_12625 [Saprospiraceae bacterium]|nr:hypothetical protein [Saprospiraceae bacterium]